MLQEFTEGPDGIYHSSSHRVTEDWIRLRTNNQLCQENTFMAARLVKNILLNSWVKAHFQLPLYAKQNILSQIVALEDSYKEYFASQANIIPDSCPFLFLPFLVLQGVESYSCSKLFTRQPIHSIGQRPVFSTGPTNNRIVLVTPWFSITIWPVPTRTTKIKIC